MITNLPIEEELKSACDRFIQFGTMLDYKMRSYLVQYILQQFYETEHSIPDLDDRYYQYFSTAISRIFQIKNLLNLTKINSNIKKQVILDTIHWLKSTYQKATQHNPYDDEQNDLKNWGITPHHMLIKRWKTLCNYLKVKYRQDEIDIDFYVSKFTKYTKQDSGNHEKQREQFEMIYHDLLRQWDALLHAKIIAYHLEKLEEDGKKYTEYLDQKVKEYSSFRKLLNPFTEFFGWDMSRKLWEQTSFDIIHQYDELLEDEQSIKDLADLLGNLREAQIELQDESFEKTMIRREWISDTSLRSEIVGIQESNDLSTMLSSEVALLSDDDTETLFLKKFVDEQLLTFRYEDKILRESKEQFIQINQRVKQKEKGPFIICIDTSESMEGRPEQIAKVLTLAILKMSMHQNRKAYLINFSAGIQTIDLYNIADQFQEIVAFLQMSFHGGTDVSLAFYEALRQLEKHDYEDADVLMVSDFIMHKLEDDIESNIAYFQQNKNTQFHCLTLGKYANTDILKIFDTNWVYDTVEKGIIKSLNRDFQDIMNRY